MQSWERLTVAEQTLVRRALSGAWLAGTVQIYGMALRWAGVQNVPPRSYTDEEQRRLVPILWRSFPPVREWVDSLTAGAGRGLHREG